MAELLRHLKAGLQGLRLPGLIRPLAPSAGKSAPSNAVDTPPACRCNFVHAAPPYFPSSLLRSFVSPSAPTIGRSGAGRRETATCRPASPCRPRSLRRRKSFGIFPIGNGLASPVVSGGKVFFLDNQEAARKQSTRPTPPPARSCGPSRWTRRSRTAKARRGRDARQWWTAIACTFNRVKGELRCLSGRRGRESRVAAQLRDRLRRSISWGRRARPRGRCATGTPTLR